MRRHVEHHVEIARRPAAAPVLALAREAQSRAAVDARRDAHLDLAPLLDLSPAAALRAGVLDHAPRAAAARAGPRQGEESLGEAHLAAPAAAGAGHRLGAAPAAAAAARRAALEARDVERLFVSERRLLESDLEVVAQVGSGRRSPGAPPRAAEQVAEAEEVAQDVAEIGEDRGIEPAGAARHPLVAEAVVARPLVGIREDGVGLRRLLEALLGGVVPGVAVGMVADRGAAVGGLDLRRARVALDPQHFVIIAPRGAGPGHLVSRA